MSGALPADATGMSDLVKVGADGSVQDLGPITGLPSPGPLSPGGGQYNNGAFVNGTFYIAVNYPRNFGFPTVLPSTLYAIALGPTAHVSQTIPLTGDGWVSPDFAQSHGFLWGIIGPGSPPMPSDTSSTIQRLDPANGVVKNFTSNVVTGDAFGAAWTFGNGNLGVSDNASGVVSQIAIGDPGSASPTFTLISQAAGPPNALNDGTSCVPATNSNTDLGIVKSGPVAAHPGDTITWTLG